MRKRKNKISAIANIAIEHANSLKQRFTNDRDEINVTESRSIDEQYTLPRKSQASDSMAITVTRVAFCELLDGLKKSAYN